jgi:hypothetical protein
VLAAARWLVAAFARGPYAAADDETATALDNAVATHGIVSLIGSP